MGKVPAIVTADPPYAAWTVSQGDVSISLDAYHRFDSLILGGMVYTFELDLIKNGLTVTTGGSLTSGGIKVGEARVFDAKNLLEKFTAVDRTTLEARGVSTSALTNLKDTSLDPTSTYLWLLEKDAAASGSGEVNARQVTVFGLISATPAIDPGTFDLTFKGSIKKIWIQIQYIEGSQTWMASPEEALLASIVRPHPIGIWEGLMQEWASKKSGYYRRLARLEQFIAEFAQ